MAARREFYSVDEAAAKARKFLPASLYAALEEGSEAGRTNAANVSAFGRVAVRPRAGVVTQGRNVSTTVLGKPVAMPVLLAPVGKVRIVHPDGAVGAARAAADAGVAAVATTACGHPLGDVGRVGGRQWLQLGAWSSRAGAEALLSDASAAGFEALVVTLDCSVSPNAPVGRPVKIDLHNARRYGPELARRPGWFCRFIRDGMDLSLASVVSPPTPGSGPQRPQWDDFTWLRAAWPGPIIAKGVLSAEDAKRAADYGLDALIVSNHGGKSLDCVPATLDALPEVVAAAGDDVEILLDGGIRHGTDVVVAVAMGAKAVLIGRPFLWGLAIDGQAGVRRILELFRDGIDRTLGLLGCPSISEVDGSYLSAVQLGSGINGLPSRNFR
jgi:isopentenyl diphosphate isomerase/L-lactate dehydrogenase-like FMN-dependent dehydrogenase